MLAMVVASVAVLGLLSPTALADDPGWWASSDAGVQAAWASGIDGQGVTVAMLDTMPVSDDPAFSDADVTYALADTIGGGCHDYAGKKLPAAATTDETFTYSPDGGSGTLFTTHGTMMLAALTGNGTWYDGTAGPRGVAPKTKVLFYTVGGIRAIGEEISCQDENGKSQTAAARIGATVGRAVDKGARLVSMSLIWRIYDYDYEGLLKALRHGVILVEGRENALAPGLDTRTGNPASLNGFPGSVQVNSVAPDGGLAPTSDIEDASVSILSPGMDVTTGAGREYEKTLTVGNGGTSTATANLSGYLALAMQRWPEATGNQILQSLIRSTDQGQGEVKADNTLKRGFGQVDVARLLDTDPTQYPDINPILEMQINTAAKTESTKDWYTRDCRPDDPDADLSAKTNIGYLNIPCEATQLATELKRQQDAWKNVKQCRSDGGDDCMRYSATATADQNDDADAQADGDAANGTTTIPAWAWAAGGGVIITAGIIIAVIASRRHRKGQSHAPGNPPAAGTPPYATPTGMPPYRTPTAPTPYTGNGTRPATPTRTPPQTPPQTPQTPAPTPMPPNPNPYGAPQAYQQPGSQPPYPYTGQTPDATPRHGRHAQ